VSGITSIRSALQVALAAIAPAIDTVWENTAYTPILGTPYQRVFLLPSEPENPEVGAKFTRERGILQITLVYPLRAGPEAAAARAELIRAAFKRGTSLVSGGVTVIIERTPEVAPAMFEPDVYTLPVRVRYFSNILSP
jgi:hypothetical protein